MGALPESILAHRENPIVNPCNVARAKSDVRRHVVWSYVSRRHYTRSAFLARASFPESPADSAVRLVARSAPPARPRPVPRLLLPRPPAARTSPGTGACPRRAPARVLQTDAGARRPVCRPRPAGGLVPVPRRRHQPRRPRRRSRARRGPHRAGDPLRRGAPPSLLPSARLRPGVARPGVRSCAPRCARRAAARTGCPPCSSAGCGRRSSTRGARTTPCTTRARTGGTPRATPCRSPLATGSRGAGRRCTSRTAPCSTPPPAPRARRGCCRTWAARTQAASAPGRCSSGASCRSTRRTTAPCSWTRSSGWSRRVSRACGGWPARAAWPSSWSR